MFNRILSTLFSETRRKFKILILILLIGLIAVLNIFTGPKYSPDFHTFVKNLDQYRGKDHQLFMIRVDHVADNGVWIRSSAERQLTLFISGRFFDLKPGDIVSMSLKIGLDGRAEARSYHRHRGRPEKYLVSLMALLPVFFIWRGQFTWDGKDRVFRRRSEKD